MTISTLRKGIMIDMMICKRTNAEIKEELDKIGQSCSLKSIYKILDLYKKAIDLTPETSSGRKKVINEQERNNMIMEVENNPKLTAADIHRDSYLNPNNACARTILNVLIENGYQACLAKKVIELIPNSINERQEFGEDHSTWELEDWMNVYFSDEPKIFCQKQGIQYVKKQRGDEWTKEMMIEENPFHNGLETMVWGLISSKGPEAFIKVESNINSKDYIQILKNHVIKEEEFQMGAIFQQDYAPCHKSKKVIGFLETNEIPTLRWPPQSPYLSPIENVWAHLKNKLFEEKDRILDKQNLFRFAKKIFFDDSTKDLIQKLYQSLPKRIELLNSSDGTLILKY